MSDEVKGLIRMRRLELLKQDELEERGVTASILALAASDEKRIKLEQIDR